MYYDIFRSTIKMLTCCCRLLITQNYVPLWFTKRRIAHYSHHRIISHTDISGGFLGTEFLRQNLLGVTFLLGPNVHINHRFETGIVREKVSTAARQKRKSAGCVYLH